MKFINPAEHVLVPLIISVRSDTAQLLSEMANELEISLDELISGIAEDQVTVLGKTTSFANDVDIPDSCSTETLLKFLE